MERKPKSLKRNPEILKLNISSAAQSINELMRKKARLTHEWHDCFSLDSDGLPLVRENDYKTQIDAIEDELIQAYRVLIRFQEEYKEFAGGMNEPGN